MLGGSSIRGHDAKPGKKSGEVKSGNVILVRVDYVLTWSSGGGKFLLSLDIVMLI